MKALLDTHAFLWWVLDDKRISVKAKRVIRRSESNLYVSAASIWEMVIKIRVGKLELPDPPLSFIEDQLKINHLNLLPITHGHAMNVHYLPLLHRDPFDRMLVAQARSENIPILSGDTEISKYDVEIIW